MPRLRRAIPLAVAILLASAGYMLLSQRPKPPEPHDLMKEAETIFVLESPAFENNSEIPAKYSLRGGNKSPPLRWRGSPSEAAALVLIAYDPDAPGGTFCHWLLYNMPPNLTSLPEGMPAEAETPYGLQGVDDYGELGYGGPAPPPGSRHRYVFLLLALDRKLGLAAGATAEEVLEACRGHVIGYAVLLGYYGG